MLRSIRQELEPQAVVAGTCINPQPAVLLTVQCGPAVVEVLHSRWCEKGQLRNWARWLSGSPVVLAYGPMAAASQVCIPDA